MEDTNNMSLSADEIAQMSIDEKLQLIGTIWADLSRSESNVESPAWHEDALKRTDERLVSGHETTRDWANAKRRL